MGDSGFFNCCAAGCDWGGSTLLCFKIGLVVPSVFEPISLRGEKSDVRAVNGDGSIP